MQTVKEESYQAIFRKYYPRMFYYAKRIVGEDAGSPDKSGGKFFNSI